MEHLGAATCSSWSVCSEDTLPLFATKQKTWRFSAFLGFQYARAPKQDHSDESTSLDRRGRFPSVQTCELLPWRTASPTARVGCEADGVYCAVLRTIPPTTETLLEGSNSALASLDALFVAEEPRGGVYAGGSGAASFVSRKLVSRATIQSRDAC